MFKRIVKGYLNDKHIEIILGNEYEVKTKEESVRGIITKVREDFLVIEGNDIYGVSFESIEDIKEVL